MANIITISGKARGGKNTLADMLKEEIEQCGFNVAIMAYADYLKLICEKFYGWDGQKNEIGRTILQQVGTDKIRKTNPNFWVSIVSETIQVLKQDYQYFIIADTRFPNEIQYLKNQGYNVLSLYVERPDLESGLNKEQLQHPSETSLLPKDCDLFIINDNLDNLRKQARCIVSELI